MGAFCFANLITMAKVAAEPALAAKPDESAREATQHEIVVEGRRNNERYRLPQEFRTTPAPTSHRLSSIDPRLSCRAVGPRGCGLDPLPILTFKSDGSVEVGVPKAN